MPPEPGEHSLELEAWRIANPQLGTALPTQAVDGIDADAESVPQVLTVQQRGPLRSAAD